MRGYIVANLEKENIAGCVAAIVKEMQICGIEA